jgi:glycosyltransferase involved in cell wall biosynthesis
VADAPPVRVLHLMRSAGSHVGGMERLVSAVADRLRPLGFSAVLCLHRAGPWAQDVRASGHEVYGLDEDTERRHGGGRLVALRRRVRRLRAIIDAERVDVVHTHYLGALLHAYLGRVREHCAWVHTEHARPDVADYPRWLRVLGERLLSAPDRVTAVSEPVGQYLRGRLGRRASRVSVIANGVDVERFAEARDGAAARRALGLASDAWVIGCVANLRPEKNHDVLLEAFARVAATVHAATLVLVGEGECRAALERRALELGVAPHVRFLGMRADVPDLFAAFDVHCLASRYEGMPLAVLESMAASVPVVASAVPAVREIVADGDSGLLFSPGDPAALKEALLRLRRDPSLGARLARRAREEVAERFRIEGMVERYSVLYRDVARGVIAAPGSASVTIG